ncbi:polysaccharide deacetylase family protein [Dictyobacter aurantiacus]|uniref:NodB homology domain-containing protein n=1 Tax=Dictyobacter aurantiacus TaxID=1936993 RepID=A0A401ZA16_9CHLR|nr:polysaccharide deacetylase family protein [Dictyobacter aurantiacus]GCE03720.1 hypothetical protein KDAU_10490 [Dictyobacter aurantiacus]
MRKAVRLIVAAFFYYSGLVRFSRWRMRQRGPRLLILNYHRASLGDIRRHMQYLKRHYRILHLEDALEELYASQSPARKSGQQPTPLVITFDDGYHDNYTHAFKAAVEFQVPITIFLIPGYIDSGEYFWWGEGERLVKQTGLTEFNLDGQVYYLQQPASQQALSQAIDARLRSARSVAEREQFLTQMRQDLAIVPDTCEETVKDVNIPLSWGEVLEMQESGFVSFGAHTMNHPVLACLSDPTEVRYEIASCRHLMQERLNRPVRTFAYPIGRTEHIGLEALKTVREAGYSWAVTTTKGVATPQSDPYRLERVLVEVRRHWLLIAAETSGIWSMFAPLWKPFTKNKENM